MYSYVIFWAGTMILSLLMRGAVRAAVSRQTAISYAPRIAMLGWKAIVAPLLFGILVFALAIGFSAPWDEFFAGGIALTQLAGLAVTVRAWQFQRALAQPGAASGHVDLSSALVYRSTSADLFGLSLVYLGLFLLLRRAALAGGALFLCSTAVGYLRRASQATVKAKVDSSDGNG